MAPIRKSKIDNDHARLKRRTDLLLPAKGALRMCNSFSNTIAIKEVKSK